MPRIVSTLLRTAASATALLAIGSAAHAQDATLVDFAGPDGLVLTGVLYTPAGYQPEGSDEHAAVVMLHGCSGIWSERVVDAANPNGTPNLQNHIEKWGHKLASLGIVALAVDSYTPREPDDIDVTDPDERSAWQYQCNEASNPYATAVGPYDERVADARAAYDFLVAEHDVDPGRVGLLGWSQGAESVLVEAAATPRTANTPRAETDLRFATSVVYYPGCGDDLQFGGVNGTYWRPYADFRMNIGEKDPFYASCKRRVHVGQQLVSSLKYPPLVAWQNYDLGTHGFDRLSQSWPIGLCAAPASGDTCAMYDSDIRSLEFFLSNLL